MSILLYMTGGQLTEYEGDIAFILGPQSSYGYEFPLVVGTAQVSLRPGSQCQIEHHEIGHVQLSLHPQGHGAIEHHEIGSVRVAFHTLRTIHYADYVYQGNIGISLSPASPIVHDFPPVIGGITLDLAPQGFYSQEWACQGSILFALAPASGHFADYPYQGGIALNPNPVSSHFADYVFAGAIPVSLNPHASYGQDFAYRGAAVLALIPASSFVQDFSYKGDALVILLPQTSGLLEKGKDFFVFNAPILSEIFLEAVISRNRLFVTPGMILDRELEAYISRTLTYRATVKGETSNDAGR
jgi:hypothetical protein